MRFGNWLWGVASYRLGWNGKKISPNRSRGVGAFPDIDSAWDYLQNQREKGKTLRLIVVQHSVAPTFPIGYEHGSPFYNDDGSLWQNGIDGEDYIVLQWDASQNEYYWEGQNNGSNDPKGGQYWQAAYPWAERRFNTFLVVEITEECKRNAQGLPKVPWEE